MPEYTGTLQAFELSSTLWSMPALPLLLAAIVAVGRARSGAARPDTGDRWCLGAVAAALVSALGHSVWLAGLPPFRRLLLDPLWPLIRCGSLDLDLSLALDPFAAVLAVVIALVGLVAIVGSPRDRSPAPLIALAVGAGELTVLADNLAIMVIGWHLVGVAAWLLCSARDPAEALVARFTTVTLIVGMAILFWAGGGSWANGTFLPDYHPRLVAVEGQAAAVGATGLVPAEVSGALSVSALPGAHVYAGDADVCSIDSEGKPGGLGFTARPCREIAVTPFWHVQLPSARHDLRVDAGPGTNQLLVDKLRIAPGGHTSVALVGSTLVFREMGDWLKIKIADGTTPLAADLAAKQLGGMSALGLALFLLVIAAVARSGWVGAARTPAASPALAAAAIGTLGGVVLLARLSPLLTLSPAVAGLAALLGAGGVLVGGARTLRASDPRRLLAHVVTAQIGFAMSAVACGAISAAVLQLVVHLLALTAWALVLDAMGDGARDGWADVRGLAKRSPRLARALTFATMAATGAPWPLVGAFWSRDAALWATFGTDATGPVPGTLVVAVAVLGSALLAAGLWRACLIMTGGKPPADLDPDLRCAPLALGLAVAALGVGLLGATDVVIGGSALVAPIKLWIGDRTDLDVERLGAGIRLLLFAVSFALPLAGWSTARRKYGGGADPAKADKALPRIFAFELSIVPRAVGAFDAAGQTLLVLDDLLDRVVGAPARLLSRRDADRAAPTSKEKDGSS